MAPTYTPNDALSVCAGFIRQMSIPATTTTILMDQVHSDFWKFSLWRWTKATLTAISLVDGQDYAVTNTDLYRLTNIRIVRTDLTPNISRPLDIAEHLEPDLQVKYSLEGFRACSWEADISKIRLDGSAQVVSPVTMQIAGDYQKLPTKIVTGNLATAFVFPDIYFETFTEGLLYRLYKYVTDDRTGSVVVTKNGRRQYTGQLAVWMQRLQEATEAEDLGSGQAYRFPAEPLGIGRGSWPGPIF